MIDLMHPSDLDLGKETYCSKNIITYGVKLSRGDIGRGDTGEQLIIYYFILLILVRGVIIFMPILI